MADLALLTQSTGPLTPEHAATIKQNLTELARQGEAALPAIQDFLRQQVDVDFNAAGLARVVGASSLRQGLLDILQGIPGQGSADVAAEALKTSPFPEEIAKLMSILEKQSPGTFRQEGIAAARETLALAAEGQLTGQKVSPAFEILQTYGDASVLPDLVNALNSKWRQNAALALSELPDGIGIPTLVELANDPSSTAYGRGDLVLRPLAQVSLRYPEAFNALLSQVQQNRVPDSAWPTIISALAGNDYISNGRILQDTRPSTDLNELAGRRVALLDKISAAANNPAVAELIAQQRATLARHGR